MYVCAGVRIAASAQYRRRREICGVLWSRSVTTVDCRPSDDSKYVSGIWSNCRLLSHWWSESQLLAADGYATVMTALITEWPLVFNYFLRSHAACLQLDWGPSWLPVPPSGTVCCWMWRWMWPLLYHCLCLDNAWRQFYSATDIWTLIFLLRPLKNNFTDDDDDIFRWHVDEGSILRCSAAGSSLKAVASFASYSKLDSFRSRWGESDDNRSILEGSETVPRLLRPRSRSWILWGKSDEMVSEW